MMAFLFMMIGIPVFLRARKEAEVPQGEKVTMFTPLERRFAVLLVIAGIIGCFVLAGQSPEVAKHYHRWAKWAEQEWVITIEQK